MDRRRLGLGMSKSSILQKQLSSSSQLGITRTNSATSASQVMREENRILPKSTSALESSFTDRKRQKSGRGESKSSDDENDEEVARIVSKKRKTISHDDDGDDDDDDDDQDDAATADSDDGSKKIGNAMDDSVDVEGTSDSPEPPAPRRIAKPGLKSSKFMKPESKRKSDSDKEDEGEKNKSLKGSYIMGRLESIDRSPSKLSQTSNHSNRSSTSSADKYRRINLRAPLSKSKAKKSASKPLLERIKERTVLSQELSQKASSSGLQNKKEELKKSQAKQASKKNEDQDLSVTSFSDEGDMSFSDSESSPKKISKVSSQSSSQKASKGKKSNKSPPRSNSPSTCVTSPKIKQSRNRVPDSPELSPIRELQSPERNLNIQNRRSSNDQGDKFSDFINQMGIILCSGENLHVATEDPRDIIQKMKDLFDSNKISIDEIVNSWNSYIENDENLSKSLFEMKVEQDGGTNITSKGVSLCRLLLQVPQLQIDILTNLFKKLIDSVLTTDSADETPWATRMLQQFRFLEMLVDPDFLIKQIEELLSSSPEWFQRVIIVFIPDIVTDSQHQTTAEMLVKIMENNGDLTNIILDCIHDLNLGKEYREELREQVLGLLQKDFDKSVVPNITRFVLTACATEAIALKSFKALRMVDMSPSSKEKLDECYTRQMFMINAIKTNIQLFKEVVQAAIAIVKAPMSEAKPLDFILTILLYETIVPKKKIIEAALHSHIKDNYYKTTFLSSLYSKFKEVLKSFQASTLNLAMNLLKDNSPTHVEFAIEWLRNIFVSQEGVPHKQREILDKLLKLMGNKDRTVKNSLEVICRMADNEHEYRFLENHAGFLRSYLEKVDNLEFDEVASLYHLLFGLCTQSEKIYDALNDDLEIILKKQLSSSKVITKCKGVIGAVMSIKHLAGIREKSDEAFTLMSKTLTSLKSCVRSQALFYDQMGQIIVNTENIDNNFLDKVTGFLEDRFVNDFLVENNSNGNLDPKYCLNDPSRTEVVYYVRFGSSKYGACLSVLFKLFRICSLRLNGSLESINAVLGCSVLMPQEMDMPEPETADFMIHCINWFRELISGFVAHEERLMREMVIKRLENLMTLQGEFASMVSMCDIRYQPPPCYFHYFPTPQFLRIEMKLGKKGAKRGKKSKKADKEKELDNTTELSQSLRKVVDLPEWENWEIGSEITVKNPAFFRRMDTNIINLFDVNLDTNSTSSEFLKLTIAQVCFIVKELIGMFRNDVSESFIRGIIQLLPKICSKLKKIAENLKDNENAHEKEALRLILCFLITLFNWKEFESARYNTLLRDGLRALAAMESDSNVSLRSCKDLVAKAYQYFENLSAIATNDIAIAVALVNTCTCLMKHSHTFTENYKDRHAHLAYSFLKLEWHDVLHGHQYKAAIKELIKTWIDNESNPLKTVYSVTEWLVEQVESLTRPQSRLEGLPAVTTANLNLLLKQLFSGFVRGIDISLGMADSDSERVQAWLEVADGMTRMASICKSLKNKNNNKMCLVFYLRYMTMLYQTILTNGIKFLEVNIKYEMEVILNVIQLFQKSGRFLTYIFNTARKEKNVSLLTLIPVAKLRREKFIYKVKGMLTANNSIEAFWMGNLMGKDVDGEDMISENSEDLGDISDINDNAAEDATSEIFESDDDDESEE